MHPLFPYTTLVRSGGSLPPDPPPGGSQGVVRMQKLLMAGFWLFLLSLPIHAAAQGRPIEGHQNLRLGMSVAEAVAAEPRARPDDGCPSGRCLGYFDRRFLTSGYQVLADFGQPDTQQSIALSILMAQGEAARSRQVQGARKRAGWGKRR